MNVERLAVILTATATFLGVFIPVVNTLLTRGKKQDPAAPPVATGLTVDLAGDYVGFLKSRLRFAEHQADVYRAALVAAGLPIPDVPDDEAVGSG